jgi:hypothetical protein
MDAERGSGGKVGQEAMTSGKSDFLDLVEALWKENNWVAL